MAVGCTLLTHGSESVVSESPTIQSQTVSPPPSILVRLIKSLSSQEWLLVFCAFVSLYLINGTYAPIICSLCTTVPAVIHSYQIITEDNFCPEAYRATLCYWILQGALTGFDHLIGQTFAYYFLKFLLMSMVYTHMISKSCPIDYKTSTVNSWQSAVPNASSEMMKLDKSTTEEVGAPLTSKNSSLTNFVKWRQNAGGDVEDDEILQHSVGEMLMKNSETTLQSVSKNPTASLAFFSPATSNFGEVPISSNDPISDFRDALDSPIATLPKTSERTIPSQTTISSTDWDRTWTALPTLELNRFRKPFTTNANIITDSRTTLIGRPIQKTSHETIPCYEGDINAIPDSTIIFRKPFTELQTIYLKNVTNNKILWAIKTNAVDKIIATPTCGLISAGATLHLKVAIRENAKIAINDCGHDRFAVDYVFVDSSTLAFDPGLLVDNRNALRRKAFEIKYIF